MNEIVYFNFRGAQGLETVDELSREDFPSRKAFRDECERIEWEYRLAGMHVYTSSRPCANWQPTTTNN